jgi:NADH-quinone oxidoreductase subunit C
LFCDRHRYHDVVAAHRDAGFEMLASLTAVDYLGHPGRALPAVVEPERFELVVMLLSLAQVRRVRIRVQVPEVDAEVSSLWDLYRGAEAMEREAYDMYGISFRGHPDLTRILMPEDWEGHPLRKDFGVGRVPVQFKHAPGPR